MSFSRKDLDTLWRVKQACVRIVAFQDSIRQAATKMGTTRETILKYTDDGGLLYKTDPELARKTRRTLSIIETDKALMQKWNIDIRREDVARAKMRNLQQE